MAEGNINAKTLRDMLEHGEPVTVVDVRKVEDRAEWSIPGSVHFDAYDALNAGDERAMEGLDLPPRAHPWSPSVAVGAPAPWPQSNCGGGATRCSPWRAA